ncbi:MAG: ubiquinone biosynthesis protein UbiH [Comamonadaceae bacterium]|nr:MAG: ubiquinone biosynthesis protein UbiH [Comamonadaceae bacterium]
MAQAFDVCVRGAGIVGRSLALLLARDRLRVALVAQEPPVGASSDVRAYAMNDASRELLQSLRSWPDPMHATAVATMQVHGDDGGKVSFSASTSQADALAWIVDVPPLQAQLVEAVRYQPLIDVVDAPQPAPLTVVCEGRASSTRAEFNVDFDVTPYPQQAIASRLVCEKPHGQVASQWFSQGETLAFLPLGGPDGNLVALVWSVHESRAGGLLALDAAAFAAEVETASQGALGKLTLQSERAAWPLQLARASRWVGTKEGRGWALAGDAAHTVHPLAGQGLNLGLADAAELARVLHEREYWRGVGDERLLRRYERARKADVVTMGLATDGLQQLFAQPSPPLQALRNWGMKGFERSGPLKAWVARQAMGLRQNGLKR